PEIAGDDAVAGELVEPPHEAPVVAPVLLLPGLLRDRRVPPPRRVLPGAHPARGLRREWEAPPVQEPVVDDVERLESPAGDAAGRSSRHVNPPGGESYPRNARLSHRTRSGASFRAFRTATHREIVAKKP